MYQKVGKSALKKDLNNITRLCEILNHPQQDFPSIHIAGTNGKGSTAHMLASVFQESGLTVGLYTSPHLKDFRERIKINGQMISEKRVIDFVSEYQIEFEKIAPSFFEWTVALAFNYFSVSKVDVAVIETGLGGRLDSTNIIRPILSLITNIGFDHMDLLGNTLEEIATEKAGIMKPQIPTIVGDDSGVRHVFMKRANDLNIPIIYGNEVDMKSYETDLKGNYQNRNAHLVHLAVQQLKQIGYTISDEQFERGLLSVVKNTGLRGRWEILNNQPFTIAETAHNLDGITLAMTQLKQYDPRKIHFVLGFVADKNLEEILALFPTQSSYYFCEARIPRALDKNKLQALALERNLKGKSYNSVLEAKKAAESKAEKDEIIYIGGSNFVVAEAL